MSLPPKIVLSHEFCVAGGYQSPLRNVSDTRFNSAVPGPDGSDAGGGFEEDFAGTELAEFARLAPDPALALAAAAAKPPLADWGSAAHAIFFRDARRVRLVVEGSGERVVTFSVDVVPRPTAVVFGAGADAAGRAREFVAALGRVRGATSAGDNTRVVEDFVLPIPGPEELENCDSDTDSEDSEPDGLYDDGDSDSDSDSDSDGDGDSDSDGDSEDSEPDGLYDDGDSDSDAVSFDESLEEAAAQLSGDTAGRCHRHAFEGVRRFFEARSAAEGVAAPAIGSDASTVRRARALATLFADRDIGLDAFRAAMSADLAAPVVAVVADLAYLTGAEVAELARDACDARVVVQPSDPRLRYEGDETLRDLVYDQSPTLNSVRVFEWPDGTMVISAVLDV